MNLEQWYTLTDRDWKSLEEQFTDSYYPVLQFITENKGSFSEARDVYIEAFFYYTRSVELKGESYLKNAQGLIYSFSRIIWLKKLQKRNVDTNYVSHRREFYDLDHAFHEIDLMTERSQKAASKLALIGEPCRTLMLELIGHGKPFEEVGPRLGFTVEDRALNRLSGCVRKLVELTESKVFEVKQEEYTKCLKYVLNPEKNEKPSGPEIDVCLAMTSRVVATVKNHISSKQRTSTLREFRDRLLPDDANNLQKLETEPKKRKMKSFQIIAIAASVAVIVSVLTSFGIYNFPMDGFTKETEATVNIDTIAVDTVKPVPAPVWKEKSAFLISNDGYMLTTSKDLTKGQKVKLGNDLDSASSAGVLAVDRSSGLALLKLDSAALTAVPFRFSQNGATLGEEMISLGYTNGKLEFTEATTRSTDENATWIGGNALSPGAPLISEQGELKGLVVDTEDGNRSANVDEILEFLDEKVVQEIALPKRNRLYYGSTSQRVEKLKPCIYKVRFKV